MIKVPVVSTKNFIVTSRQELFPIVATVLEHAPCGILPGDGVNVLPNQRMQRVQRICSFVMHKRLPEPTRWIPNPPLVAKGADHTDERRAAGVTLQKSSN